MRILFLVVMVLNLNVFASAIVGATKGSFNVSQGSALYNLEIFTPKGIAGLKPTVGVNFNSSIKADGILGVGFHLSGLSIILKCKQTLLKEKKDSSRNYNYCLYGQKIVLKNTSDIYGSATEYKMEIENYSKIIKRDNFWIVYTKDGLIYEYGNTLDSKDLNAFYRLNKISDRYDNHINFIYNSSKKISKISYSNNSIDFIYKDRINKRILYKQGQKFELNHLLKKVSVRTNNI